MAARLLLFLVSKSRLFKSYWFLSISLAVLVIGFVSYWFTEPLDDQATVALLRADKVVDPARTVPTVTLSQKLAWPESKLEGEEAKRLVLAILEDVSARLDKVQDYTATFLKQERLNGKLGPNYVMEMKVRHRPFSVYFQFVEPQKGKEVVYAEGRHDNKVIAHGGGFSRLLIPRLAVPPDHPLALADSRHAVTEAGIANLTRRLIAFRKLDLNDREATTVLDRVLDAKQRPRLRSVHTHPRQNPERPFARVEVVYDPDSFFPVGIQSFDWPNPDETGALRLAEAYAYENLKLDASLTALDFDPANPEYSFHRY